MNERVLVSASGGRAPWVGVGAFRRAFVCVGVRVSGGGRVSVFRFELPLPLGLVGRLAEVADGELFDAGYTDVMVEVDGLVTAVPEREEPTG